MSLETDYLNLLRRYQLPEPRRYELAEILPLLDKLRRSEQLPEAASAIASGIASLERDMPGWLDAQMKKARQGPSGRLDDVSDALVNVLKENGIVLSADFYFGEFPTGDFNACAMSTESGYLCLLNTGMLDLLANMSMVYCYGIAGRTSQWHPAVGDSETDWTFNRLSREQVRQQMAGAARSVVTYLAFGEHSYPTEVLKDINPYGLVAAALIQRGMELFVAAHELAHVKLGHVRTSQARPIRTTVGDLTTIAWSQIQEAEADQLAQSLLLMLAKPGGQPGPLLAGGLCFITTDLIVQQFSTHIYGTVFDADSPAATHPPSRVRLRLLIEWLSKHLDAATLAKVSGCYDWARELGVRLSSVTVERGGDGVTFLWKASEP